jgi:hypothetical protein
MPKKARGKTCITEPKALSHRRQRKRSDTGWESV